ncbi:MAG: ATP-binding protein [Clostridia bacterium]|nr:ATP-binding protein [Clostridia bacterium]
MINLSKNYVLEEAENIIEERKIKAETLVLKYEEFLNNKPEYIEACNKKNRIIVKIAEKKFNNLDVGNLYGDLKKAEEDIISIQQKYEVTLDMLKPNYSCKICNDKGYIGAEKCICLKRVYNNLLIKESNINFDDFEYLEKLNLDFYEGANTKKSIELLRTVIEKFDETQRNTFLILGKSGTGKTYAMKSFAKSLSEKGKTVLYLTAFGINNMFLEMTLGGYETKKKILNQLLDADLLLIDDLGTEQIYKNVTIENLYNILDERINLNKRIMISTNLTPNEVLDKYDVRIYSRLFHKGKTLNLHFDGADIRLRSI